ncbi:MAG: phosphocholine cytidylyltransferase family protein [Tenericutes bacterium]|nr:phosphocholine cytidylyltransferase family protein [Mycoplasmatota bacterium]
MKALILAAGYGKRLKPLTDTIPKSMVEVNGVPLLVNSLNNLLSCGIDEIGIVVGHMADYIKEQIGDNWNGVPITYYENKRYRETNNIVSLYQALKFCDDDMIMLECDIYYHKEMIENLLKGQGECSILVSQFNKETMDGTVIEVEKDEAISLVLGKWQNDNYDYKNSKKTVNMYKFSKNFMQRKYAPLIRWYVENVSENSYYEKVLGMLIYLHECDIRIVNVPEDMWCEIDNVEDLERAKSYFKSN